jgi:hypothetical protein
MSTNVNDTSSRREKGCRNASLIQEELRTNDGFAAKHYFFRNMDCNDKIKSMASREKNKSYSLKRTLANMEYWNIVN